MRIKTPSVDRKVVNLSGGNQQKVVLGKWLAMKPKVLILDEPTRGIDVGAKAEIYRTMAEAGGHRNHYPSWSVPKWKKFSGMSDRVVVMHERRINGILERSAVTQERVGAMMTTRDSANVN
jgi:ribose transport system ATP-binding protein